MTDSAPSLSPLIHLVDDDAAVREGLALLISTVGLRVQTWADPQSFMAGFDRASIGAIVLDVRMPGISGLEAAGRIRIRHPETRIAMCTANIQESTREAASKVGLHFVAKPITPTSIADAIAYFEG